MASHREMLERLSFYTPTEVLASPLQVPVVKDWHMFTGIFIYIVLKDVLRMGKPVGSWFRVVMILHNLGLALFSGWTFFNMVRILSKYSLEQVFNYPFLFTKTAMIDLSYYFYLSKYYEFVDTWILSLRHQNESFLQVYHHIGVLLGMGWGTRYRCDGFWVLVAANSFVHTVMYFYYFLTTIKVPVKAFKPWVTRLQITQFVVGLIAVCPYYRLASFNGPARFALAYVQVYVVVLLYLFLQFYRKAYLSKQKARKTA